MLHTPGFLTFCSPRNFPSGRSNVEWNGQPEGYCARQCVFEDLQRCANSRCLIDGSNHNRDNNLMWPDNVLTIICCFLAAILWLKVSWYVYGIKHVFTYLLAWTATLKEYLERLSSQWRKDCTLVHGSLYLGHCQFCWGMQLQVSTNSEVVVFKPMIVKPATPSMRYCIMVSNATSFQGDNTFTKHATRLPYAKSVVWSLG